MEIYLPIVEVQINIILVLFVSYIIGFLSGLFGVGGGFLMTPLLLIPWLFPIMINIKIFLVTMLIFLFLLFRFPCKKDFLLWRIILFQTFLKRVVLFFYYINRRVCQSHLYQIQQVISHY